MFLESRPGDRRWSVLFALCAAFVIGLGIGALVLPVTQGRAVAPMAEPPSSFRAVSIGTYETEVLRVIDGDTFEGRVHVWPGLDVTTKVRLRGIDAPELRARCAPELVKAQSARDALVSLLAEGAVTVGRVSLDKYGGRVLADAATRHTANVSAAMLARGLARPYSGGRRDSWCDGL